MTKTDAIEYAGIERYMRDHMYDYQGELSDKEWHTLINCYLNHKPLDTCAKLLNTTRTKVSSWYYGLTLSIVREGLYRS